MRLHIEQIEPRLFAAAVADEIVASIAESITERGQCSIVLAGGSTPAAVYRQLGKPPRVSEVNWSKVRLYLGDERFVPHTDNQSNFKMIEETLVGGLAVKPAIFPVRTELPSLAESVADYEYTIRKNERISESEIPVFDIVLLGMGEDGHTASLFPGDPGTMKSLESNRPLCVAAENTQIPAGNKGERTGRERISMSAAALVSARRMFFMVTGDNKAHMLKRVLEGDDSLQDLPAKIYTRCSHQVTWFVDTSAAKELSSR